jgi:hypothetical protein
MKKPKEQALNESLDALREMFAVYQEDREREVVAWWEALAEEEREKAFYAVCRLIYKADVVDRGTYRYALYNTFGFDEGMYMDGMNCNYMELHNFIQYGIDYREEKDDDGS